MRKIFGDYRKALEGMLDMSANGYFVNSDGVPLSVLEIRDKFAANEICKFVKTSAVHDNFFSDMQMECLYYKQYFAKNLCYLFVETQNEFSDNEKRLAFIPYNFDLTKNLKYKSFIEEDIPPVGNISMLYPADRHQRTEPVCILRKQSRDAYRSDGEFRIIVNGFNPNWFWGKRSD